MEPRGRRAIIVKRGLNPSAPGAMMLAMALPQLALGGVSGSLVGFSLGLIGGGGSILAVPLLVYLVGVPSAHVAIGTSAVAVALNAATALIGHARAGNVRWRCALVFAASGVAGAAIGSAIGKRIDGALLLGAFAVLMLVVAVLMLRRTDSASAQAVRLNSANAPWLVATGLGAGVLSGFFGIGGGFLIVPGLVFATGMPMLQAIGSSLVGVTAFGATTAFSYAQSGLVDVPLAVLFVAGGALGSILGMRAARQLAARRGALTKLFAAVIVLVAAWMLARMAGVG